MERAEYALMRGVEDLHWWYRGLRGMIDWGLTYLPNTVPERVCDVGCGAGANLIHLPGVCRVGVDFASEAVGFTRERGIPDVVRASATGLPFRGESFDLVTSFDVLCHRSIVDPTRTIETMARMLRPGGWMLVNMPAYQCLHAAHDAHVHTARRITRPVLRTWFANGGLESVRITYWNTTLFPAAVAARLISRGSKARSDLDGFRPGLTNDLLAWGPRFDRLLVQSGIALPFGLSVFGLARKPAD
jgi:SAM-dependent methyltransferase